MVVQWFQCSGNVNALIRLMTMQVCVCNIHNSNHSDRCRYIKWQQHQEKGKWESEEILRTKTGAREVVEGEGSSDPQPGLLLEGLHQEPIFLMNSWIFVISSWIVVLTLSGDSFTASFLLLSAQSQDARLGGNPTCMVERFLVLMSVTSVSFVRQIIMTSWYLMTSRVHVLIVQILFLSFSRLLRTRLTLFRYLVVATGR